MAVYGNVLVRGCAVMYGSGGIRCLVAHGSVCTVYGGVMCMIV